jgi:amino acid adenylation domain-containing protein
MQLNAAEGFELSSAQKRAWLLRESNGCYRSLAGARIIRKCELAEFHRALLSVLARHSMFRSSFPKITGARLPIQSVGTAPTCRFTTHEAADQETLWRRVLDASDKSDPTLTADVSIGQEGRPQYLVLAAPALLADVVSLRNTLYELDAVLEGAQPADEVVHYEQYAEWRRRLLQEVAANPANDVVQQLKSRVRQHGGSKGFQPAAVQRCLPRALADAVRRLAMETGAAAGHVLFSAWQCVVRGIADDAAVIGVIVDGRTELELRSAIGPYERSLPLLPDLDTLSCRDHIRRVAEAWQRLPGIEEFFDWETFREQNVAPEEKLFFPHAFQLRGSPAPLRALAIDRECSYTEPFHWRLLVIESQSELSVQLAYHGALAGEVEAHRILDRVEATLAALIANPDGAWAEAHSLGEKERDTILAAWNPPPQSDSGPLLAHHHIERIAQTAPDAIAVRHGDQSLTYRELNERATALANALIRKGVAIEAPVCLCLPRSIDLIVAIVGILKAGACYVPLNPDDPPARMRHMIEDSGGRVILSGLGAELRLPECRAEVLDIGAFAAPGASGASEIAQAIHPLNLAYLIYTSGSTGKSKGVAVTHANLVRSTTIRKRHYGATPRRFLLASNPSFDSSVAGIFWTLFEGGTLVLPPHDLRSDFSSFAALIGAQNITHTLCLPSVYALLLDYFVDHPQHTLETVIVAGEVCPQALADRHRCVLPGVALYNEYGPTEGTVWATVHECAGPQPANVPIGRPILTARVLSMRNEWQLAPIGGSGELAIGGAGVARGYWNLPAMTAEKFRPDPFADKPGQRVYRTGDLGCYGLSGLLTFLGRADEQIKVRGFRVELGEIETQLRNCPEIEDCAVIALDAAVGEIQLAGAYVSRGSAADPRRILAALSACLPDYMIPGKLYSLPALPKNANGKTDRLKLRQLMLESAKNERRLTSPRTPIQKTLAEVWKHVLHVDAVGLESNFFELGGDSIRSIQVMTQAQRAGLRFSLRDLANQPTLEALANVTSAATAAPSDLVRSGPRPFSLLDPEDRSRVTGAVEDAYPMTAMQTGMFFHGAYSSHATPYHDVMSVHLAAPFDETAFRQAVHEAIERHPILRSSFDFAAGKEPLQLVHKAVRQPVTIEDLRRHAADEQSAAIDSLYQAEIRHRFDPAQAPLLRIHVQRRTADRFQLTVASHHAVLDGWSAAVLFTEIFQRQFDLMGLPGGVNPTPCEAAFREYVDAERGLAANLEAEAFWSRSLADMQLTALPRFGEQTPAQEYYQVRRWTVPAEAQRGLNDLVRSTGASLRSILLAAHLRALSVIAGVQDVVTGVAVNGRPEGLGGDRVLGLFVNTLPLRMKASGGSWVDLIQNIRRALGEIEERRHYPLAKLKAANGGQPLFEVSFDYVDFHVLRDLAAIPGISLLEERHYNPTSLPLVVSFARKLNSADLSFSISYDSGQVSREVVERFAALLLRALSSAARESSSRYELDPLLDEDAKIAAVFTRNQTHEVFPAELCLHQLFERQAGLTPLAPACYLGSDTLSYGDLNVRANRLAHYLRFRGAEPRDRIGILLEPSLDTIAALLAVMKAGCCWVPLDASIPEARQTSILQDARVRLVLTTSHFANRSIRDGLAVKLDLEAPLIEAQPDSTPDNLPECTPKPADLAYVIYTSGSTGSPKGVEIEHRSAVNYVSWAAARYCEEPGSVFAFHTPLTFDLTITSIFAALASGQTIAICIGDPVAALGQASRDPRVNLMKATPAHLSLLTYGPAIAGQLLRLVIGGEDLDGALALRALDRLGDRVEIINEYGPTEATVGCVVHAFRRERDGIGAVPIGLPIANTTAYVLDAFMQPVPDGTPGDLYLGGACLARGYTGAPALTAGRFVPDPHSGCPGARLYRTGDRARWRAEHLLEFLGRSDTQVKVRGHRVELGEVESVLLRHPRISEAVVTAHTDPAGSTALAAYCTGKEGGALAADEVLSFSRDSLPDYMIPSTVMTLDRMPLTANGKVDRRALPRPVFGRVSRPEQVAPRTPAEEIVAQLWCETLQQETVGVTDRFLDLGGHSLMGVRLMAQTSAVFEVELPLSLLFEPGTVEGVVAEIVRARGDAGLVETIARAALEIHQLPESEIHQLIASQGSAL